MVVSLADLSQLYLQLGWAYELSSQFAQAESIYGELLTLARALHEPVMECAALNRLATQAAQNSQNLARQELIGRSLHALATLEAALGKQPESLSHAEEARILYAALGNRVREVGCLCVIAKASIDGGHLQEGIDAAKAALEITPLLVIILTEWGNVCRANLTPEAAQAAHSEALARCEDFMPPHYAGWIAGELCADCVVAGQWQQAHAYALKAAVARDPTILLGRAARWYEIAALLWGGSADQAREEVRRFGEGMNNNLRSALPYLRSLAVLAQFQGEIDAAIAHLQEATRVAEEVGVPGELWSICVELGEMYRKQGDERQANRTFARAAEILHSLADTMEDQQRRTSFLSAPVVKRVLEHIRFL